MLSKLTFVSPPEPSFIKDENLIVLQNGAGYQKDIGAYPVKLARSWNSVYSYFRITSLYFNGML